MDLFSYLITEAATAHSFNLQTNNSVRLSISSTGAVNIGGQLSCGSLLVNGSPIVANDLPALPPSTRTIGGFSVSGVLWHSTQDRLFGMRQINSNEFSLLSYSSGGSYNDKITYNHASGLPIIDMYASQYGLLNSDLDNSTIRLQLGKNRAFYNTFQLVYTHISDANAANRLDIRSWGTNNGLSITSNGRVGINNQSPTCLLEVSGSDSVVLASTAFQDGYRYNISTGNWANLGFGPVSISTTLRVNGNAWIQNNIYANSDRRLKRDIESLDFDLKHYDKLNPVSYRWKTESDNSNLKSLGLVAQEVHSICAEAVSFIDNEKLNKVDDDDIEGYTMTVDYNSIHIMSVVAIKKLIKKLNEQEKQIEDLNDQIKHLTTIYSDIEKKNI